MQTRWHCPPESSCGRAGRPTTSGSSPTASSTSCDPSRRCCRSSLPQISQPLGDDVAHLPARVQRRDRVLEDHLHPRPCAAAGPRSAARSARCRRADRTRGRRRQLHDRASGGRLPAARLADQAQGLPVEQVEADPGDRVDRPRRGRRGTPPPGPRRCSSGSAPVAGAPCRCRPSAASTARRSCRRRPATARDRPVRRAGSLRVLSRFAVASSRGDPDRRRLRHGRRHGGRPSPARSSRGS